MITDSADVRRRSVATETAQADPAPTESWRSLASSFATLTGLALLDLVALAGVAALVAWVVATPLGWRGTWVVLAFAILPGMALANVGDALDPVVEFRQLARGVMTGLSVLALAAFALSVDARLGISRSDLLLALAVAGLGALISLPLVRQQGRRLLARWPRFGHRTLVLGSGGTALVASRLLDAHRRIGLRPVAAVDLTDLEGAAGMIRQLAQQHAARWGVLAPSQETADDPRALVRLASSVATSFPRLMVLGHAPVLGPRGRLDWVATGELEGLVVRDALQRPGARALKRAFDIGLALVLGLALLLPVLVISLLIRRASPGPIFYGQRRLGQDGRHFKTWKFRTMVPDADALLQRTLAEHPELRAEWERDHKLRDDPRITPIGAFLRKTSLDELPQLWNVLRGDMSFVGPRPIVDDEIEKYGDAYPVYTRVKPGITGLWQVSGRNNTTYERRVALDRHYVTHWSLWLDLFVLLHTPRAVLRQEGAH